VRKKHFYFDSFRVLDIYTNVLCGTGIHTQLLIAEIKLDLAFSNPISICACTCV